MKYPPWHEGGEGQPGFVILEVIDAFTEAGGSLERLTALLNDHIPDPSCILDEPGLAEEERHYSLEFYFYLCQFCKILLDDPAFRYTGDSEQIGIHHYITEKGLMSFPPWYSDGTKRDGYLSLSNIRSMLVYIEENMELRDRKGDPIDGKMITEETLAFVNQCVEIKYRVSRSFFEKEAVLISFEYLFYVSSLLEFLTDTADFFFNAFHYGFLYNNHLAEAIFLQPGTSPKTGLKEWFERTNSTYDLEIREKHGCLLLNADMKRQLQTGMFERYEENCISGILQAVPAVWYSFAEMATGRDLQVVVTPPQIGSTCFQVCIRWNSRRLIVKGLLWFLLAALITAVILYRGPSSGPFPAIIAAAIGIAHYLGYRNRKKLKRTEQRYIRTCQTITRQIDALQTVTGELLKERDSLEETVKARTAELEEALEQLKALDRGKTNFIANVSHELRTPLTLLTVPMEEIHSGRYGSSLPKDHQVFSLMKRNISRLRNQINQLLDFTRLDMGAQPFHPVPLDLIKYCRNLVEELNSLAKSKSLYLKLENNTNMTTPTITADPALLESLMLNLLNNAVKFTDRGGITLNLELNDSDELSLTISDTGIGFSATERTRIFERFSQGQESRDRRYEGTGLGLALVKEIVRIHGWKIEALGIPGEGASFRILIPLCNESPLELLPSAAIGKERVSGGMGLSEPLNRLSGSEGETILLVEDSPDMASLLADLIGNEYDLCWCASGAEALNRMENGCPFSLVICDMMMPGMDGLDFRETFLKETGDRELPFIYLTALADDEVRRKALASGALDYISKPFNGDELRLKIRNLLESRRLHYRQALRDSTGSERLIRMKELELRENRKQQLEEYGISRAEHKILELLKEGLQDKEIARKLNISPRTVSTHLRNLYRKTDSQNRIELLNCLYG